MPISAFSNSLACQLFGKLIPNKVNWRLIKTLFCCTLLFISIMTLSNQDVAAEDLCQNSVGRSFCRGHLGIPRLKMPQLEGRAKDLFLFEGNATCIRLDPNTVRSTQSEIDSVKVDSLVNAAIKGLFNPCLSGIITARGNGLMKFQVLDGHHRAAACYIFSEILNKSSFMIVNHLNISIQAALILANTIPGVEHHAFGQFEN